MSRWTDEVCGQPVGPEAELVDGELEDDGWTSLHHAAFWGHVSVVDVLLAADASPDSGTEAGLTPLYLAAQNGHSDIVRSLVRAGASVHRQTSLSCVPLTVAAGRGQRDVVDLLVRHGADVNHQAADQHRSTPLTEAVDNHHLEVVDALLMAGADATTTRGDGYTHLQRAVVDRRADIGELLIRRGGADPNVRLPGGVTALHIAAALGASDVVEMLLDAGADTTAQRDDGSTPLHEAAGFGRATIARRLLTAGADITATDSSGATPLHVACDERKSDVARELLQFAAETGSCCRVVNWRDRRGGATPLMRAAWSGDAELVLVLLSVPGVDASLADDKGLNALHHASLLGHVTVVDILITSGLCDVNGSGAEEPQLTIAADVNCACVNDVTTPVHLAAENGHCDVVRLLAARGATVNAVDSAGNTPLHLAVVARQPQVVECLVELTADLRLRNNAGQTATELSRSPIIRQILMKKRSLK